MKLTSAILLGVALAPSLTGADPAPQDPDSCITYFGSQGNGGGNGQNGGAKSVHCWVCHGTGAQDNNPYVDICVDGDSLDRNNGHNGANHNDWTGGKGKLNDFIWCPANEGITAERRINLVDVGAGEKVPDTFVGDDGRTYDAKTCNAITPNNPEPAPAPAPGPNPQPDDTPDPKTNDSYSKGDPHFKVRTLLIL